MAAYWLPIRLPVRYSAADRHAERRSRVIYAIFFDHEGTPCTDDVRHRKCTGRWRGQISLGYDGAGGGYAQAC